MVDRPSDMRNEIGAPLVVVVRLWLRHSAFWGISSSKGRHLFSMPIIMAFTMLLWAVRRRWMQYFFLILVHFSVSPHMFLSTSNDVYWQVGLLALLYFPNPILKSFRVVSLGGSARCWMMAILDIAFSMDLLGCFLFHRASSSVSLCISDIVLCSAFKSWRPPNAAIFGLFVWQLHLWNRRYIYFPWRHLAKNIQFSRKNAVYCVWPLMPSLPTTTAVACWPWPRPLLVYLAYFIANHNQPSLKVFFLKVKVWTCNFMVSAKHCSSFCNPIFLFFRANYDYENSLQGYQWSFNIQVLIIW